MKPANNEQDSGHGDITRPLIAWRLEQLEEGQRNVMTKLDEITVTIAQSKGAIASGRVLVASISSLIGAGFALVTFWVTLKK